MLGKLPGIKILVVALICLGCLPFSSAKAEEGVLAVAAGIAPCVEEIMEAFESQGGDSMTLVKQSSGTLARQIDQGAPYDLFLSTDPKWREWLISRDHDVRFQVCALGFLAAWVPNRPGEDETPPDLGKDRLAVPNPEFTAYGNMAKAYLSAAGLWKAGKESGRFILCGTAPQCIVTTQNGACDVALVPVITAIKAGGTFQVLKNAGTLPVEILAFGKNLTSNAERFMTFLNTDQAREIWRKWGFETPERNEVDG